MQDGASSVLIGSHDDTAGTSGGLFFRRSRGTEAAPTPLSSGDRIGLINFTAFDGGTGYDGAAHIRVLAAADHFTGSDTSDSPGLISLWTTPDGSSTIAERVRITSDGALFMKEIAGNPATLAGFAGIIAKDSGGTTELYAFDGAGVDTILSSHPSRIIDASGDPLDPSPWFMVSSSHFTGIRVVMYLSNYMRYVSGLPVSSTQFIWYESLPNSEMRSRTIWKKRARREAIQAYKQGILDASPTIELTLAQATRFIEDTTAERYFENVTRKVLDPETGLVVERTRRVARRRQVAAGTFSHKLRQGVTIDPETGVFSRDRRIADVPTPATGEIEFPDLPRWVRDRIGNDFGGEVR